MPNPQKLPPKKIRPRLEDRPDAPQPEPQPDSAPTHPDQTTEPIKPVVSTPVASTDSGGTASGSPHGAIKTNVPGGTGNLQWEAITRYDDLIHAAADPVGWPIERVRAHIIIESRGDPKAVQKNASNGWSYGLMQVVPYGVGWDGWSELVKDKAGLSGQYVSAGDVVDALYDPAINIAVGVAILESFYQQHGTLDKASSAFFTGRPDWAASDTVNHTSGAQYQRALNGLIAEQAAAGGITPAPKPEPVDVDPIRVIVGGNYPPIDYGWRSDAGLHYYGYGVNHGTQRDTEHTGVDVPVACGTKLYSPIAGVVDCVGNVGNPRWGQGCGAYADVDGGGVGNITILGDSGHKLTLGHCHTATVSPGQRVTPGQQVGTVGSMNGCHVHVEISVNRNGSYYLIEPVAALKEAMGGRMPIIYAERIPIPQPEDFDTYWHVRATRDGVPVLQRADLNAAPVRKPLAKGEDFDAVYVVVANDGSAWWVSSLGSRIPVDGTEAIGGPVIKVA